ncbi:HEPN domain-containing protein [Mariniflexile sp. HMF6888]|uniref:HEPN domain-containing protein n=1 Tax=Mariniflexile sp. HMF6888 TaxID=3373086 RepID=UPI0037B7378C
MGQETNSNREQVINKLTTFLEVKYIYKLDIVFEDYGKSLLIIVLKETSPSLTQGLSSMVAKIFQEETDVLYRIFSFEHAQQQLREENLFFIHGCHPSKLIYKSDNTDIGLKVPVIHKDTKEAMALGFENELSRVGAFMEGATFYMENKNFPQAAFMLHQYMEIWFRNAELLVMGKEIKSHSIKEHQTHIKAFAPELGRIFNMDREEDRDLLKLLDEAYITARYFKNYDITKFQLEILSEKAWHLNFVVALLYGEKLEGLNVENE